MKRAQSRGTFAGLFTVVVLALSASNGAGVAQSSNTALRVSGSSSRPVTIPVTVRVKGRAAPSEVDLQNVELAVSEDGDAQSLLSIRTRSNAPLNLMVLIQDDVVSSVGLEIKGLSDFIRTLPRGTRILVGYLRSGSLQVRHKFTADLERAAKSLRSPIGFASAAPYNPYVEVIEALRRFDAQPAGRRAILLVSDGLDLSHGVFSSSAGQSTDLQRAIVEAQRRSVAIYSFFVPTVTSSSDVNLFSHGQTLLPSLCDET